MNTWKGLQIPAVKAGKNKGVRRALRARKRAEAEARAAANREPKAA